MISDYYDYLGVPRDADSEEIISAYRQRTKECHPDMGGSEVEMKALQKARKALADEANRSRYDRDGHESYVEFNGGALFTEDGIEIISGKAGSSYGPNRRSNVSSSSSTTHESSNTTQSSTTSTNDTQSPTDNNSTTNTANKQKDPSGDGYHQPWNTENYWKRKAASSYADNKILDFIGVFASAIRGYILIPPVAILSIITAVLVLVAKDIVLFISPVNIPQTVVLPATFIAGVLLLGVFLASLVSSKDLDSSDARPFFIAFTLLSGITFVAPMLVIGIVFGIDRTPDILILLTFAAYVFFTSSYYGAYVFVQFRWPLGRLAYGIGAAMPWVVYFVSFGFTGFPVIEALGESVSGGFISAISAGVTHSVYGVFVYFIASAVIAVTEIIGTYQERKYEEEADRIDWT